MRCCKYSFGIYSDIQCQSKCQSKFFAGCAVISHDRWFLDRLATHILAFEGDSEVVWFEGNFSDYEEAKRKRLGDVEPKRVRYRKLG